MRHISRLASVIIATVIAFTIAKTPVLAEDMSIWRPGPNIALSISCPSYFAAIGAPYTFTIYATDVDSTVDDPDAKYDKLCFSNPKTYRYENGQYVDPQPFDSLTITTDPFVVYPGNGPGTYTLAGSATRSVAGAYRVRIDASNNGGCPGQPLHPNGIEQVSTYLNLLYHVVAATSVTPSSTTPSDGDTVTFTANLTTTLSGARSLVSWEVDSNTVLDEFGQPYKGGTYSTSSLSAGPHRITAVCGTSRPYVDVNVIDDSNPTLTITSPVSGPLHKLNTAFVPVKGIAKDSSGISSIKVKVDTGSFVTLPSQNYNSTTGVWRYDGWDLAPGQHTITAQASDAANPVHSTETSVTVTVSDLGNVVYVDSRAQGNNNGSSWQHAYTSIHDAVTWNTPTDADIWVAQGKYNNDSGPVIIDQTGLKLYGGFSGDETSRELRDWVNRPTIIDGQNANQGIFIYAADDNSWTVIDGFTITNCTDGVAIDSYDAVISHNKIIANKAGAISCIYGNVTVANNFITDNTAEQDAGIVSSGTGILIANNTIANNTSVDSSESGAIKDASGSAIIRNNIVAFNSCGIYRSSSTNSDYNCVFGNAVNYAGGILAGANDKNLNPQFCGGGDYHILWNSPCKNQGGIVSLPDLLDVDRQTRSVGTIDIGADEISLCATRSLTISPEYAKAAVGGCTQITANVFDVSLGQAVAGYRVDFSVDVGMIYSVTRNDSTITVPTGTQSVYGITDASGNVVVQVKGTSLGYIHCSATIAQCEQLSSKSTTIMCGTPGSFSDWPMFHHNIYLHGVNYSSIGQTLHKEWTATLNRGIYTGHSSITWASPVVFNGVVYAATDTGWLYAFDAADGTKLAEIDLGSPINGTPCVDYGYIYVGIQSADPYINKGRLYQFSLDREHGTFVEHWHYDCAPFESLTGSISVYNDAVYFGTYYSNEQMQTNGWFHTVDMFTHKDRTGSPAYMQFEAVGACPGINPDYRTANNTVEPRAYLADQSCYTTAIKCSTGDKMWEWANDGAHIYGSPLICQGYIFIPSQSGLIYRLVDNGTSPTLSTFSTGAHNNSTPAAYNGKIYFGCDNKNIYAVDIQTLQQSSMKTLDSSIIGSPAICTNCISGSVIVGSLNGVVYSLNASNLATQQWSYNIRTQDNKPDVTIRSSPALSNGRVYIIAGDQYYMYLYCFETD